ncbi:hypothetical protein GPECTOR_1g746 [Gonium pectorale]|uniref:EamA domain-containing protein n=1 Tax=Gonium pectorale TaxID=33097 RepID=A0A150H3U8_GONPE|nr:hypothetical protein GPECTOR_1g746 [Gonium pectorale]|eukprot:KXZ56827.1 hypothetical protein GPECTOR_1g746 [Gonium pectorale]
MALEGSLARDVPLEGARPGDEAKRDPGYSRLQQLYGSAILLVTAVLWASGAPATKYLFLLPAPPSAALLTACIAVITAAFLWVGLLGSAMEVGGGAGPEAAGAAGGSAATAAARRRDGTADAGGAASASAAADGEAAEAEALLMSGMHAAGAAGPVGAGKAVRRATRELRAEQEHEWEREARGWDVGGPSSEAEEREALLGGSPFKTREGQRDPAHPHLHVRHGEAGPGPGSFASGGPSQGHGQGHGDRRRPLGAGAHRPTSSWAFWDKWRPVSPISASRTGSLVGGTPSASHNGGDGGACGGEGSTGPHANGLRALGSPRPGAAELPRPASDVRPPSLDGIVAAPKSPPPHNHRSHSSACPTSTPAVVRAASRSSGGGDGGGTRVRLQFLSAPAANLPAAGLELGCYSVAANALGAWGMQRISATRYASLAQATSLVTPAMVALSGGRVGLPVWAACCCGAAGSAMVALDSSVHAAATTAADADVVAAAAGTGNGHGGGHGGVSGGRGLLGLLEAAVAAAADSAAAGTRMLLPGAHTASGGAAADAGAGSVGSVKGGGGGSSGGGLSVQTAGAVYVLLSCVFWGLGTVRLGVHSGRFPPLQLAAAAAAAYAGLALAWLSSEIIGSSASAQSDFLELGVLLRNHVTTALLLWAGLGPGALSSYLQVLGQRTVPPAQAQVLFSSTPLWSALIAQLLLPGEAMGPLAWGGGAVMLAASLLASIMQ